MCCERRAFIEGVSCRQIAELLGDYVDGTLPKSQHDWIDRHIERCAACRAFINTYKATVSAVNRLGAAPWHASTPARRRM